MLTLHPVGRIESATQRTRGAAYGDRDPARGVRALRSGPVIPAGTAGTFEGSHGGQRDGDTFAQAERWIQPSCISCDTAHNRRNCSSKDGADDPCDGCLRWERSLTRLVRRFRTSAWNSFDHVYEVQFLAWSSDGEAHVGEEAVLGFVHENGHLGHLGPELVGNLATKGLRAVGVLLGEDRGDEG